ARTRRSLPFARRCASWPTERRRAEYPDASRSREGQNTAATVGEAARPSRTLVRQKAPRSRAHGLATKLLSNVPQGRDTGSAPGEDALMLRVVRPFSPGLGVWVLCLAACGDGASGKRVSEVKDPGSD